MFYFYNLFSQSYPPPHNIQHIDLKRLPRKTIHFYLSQASQIYDNPTLKSLSLKLLSMGQNISAEPVRYFIKNIKHQKNNDINFIAWINFSIPPKINKKIIFGHLNPLFQLQFQHLNYIKNILKRSLHIIKNLVMENKLFIHLSHMNIPI